MTNASLNNYIQEHLARGASKEDITVNLIKSGWKVEDIQQAFADAGSLLSAEDIPPPPPYVPSTEPVRATPQAGGLSTPVSSVHWEDWLSARGLAVVGIVALLIGLALALKYAFDQNWITPALRVVLGILVSGVLMGIGHWLSQKYKMYGHVFIGGGGALLYLTFYAAYAFYALIPVWASFALLIATALITLLQSIYYDGPFIAAVGSIGAYLSPLLLTADANISSLELLYGLIITAVILGLAWYKDWPWLSGMSLVGSLLLFGQWSDYYTSALFAVTVAYASAYLVLVIIFTLLYSLRRPDSKFTDGLIWLNAVAGLSYYWGVVSMIDRVYPDQKGLFTFLLGVVYGAISFVPDRSGQNTKRLSDIFRHVAILLVLIAIPIQWSSYGITIGWAVAGALLVSLGFLSPSLPIRLWGVGALAFSLGRLLFIDFNTYVAPQILLNERSGVMLVLIASLALVSWLYGRYRTQWVMDEHHLPVVAELVAYCLGLWFCFVELNDYFRVLGQALSTAYDRSTIDNVWNYSQSLLLALYGILLVVPGIAFHKKYLRIFATILFGMAIFKVFLVDSFDLSQGYRIASFLSLGVILLLAAFFYTKYKEEIAEFFGVNVQPPTTPVV